MKKLNAIVNLTAALALGSFVKAAPVTLINWQGDYVASTQQMNIGSATASGTTNTYQYSITTAKSPTSGYTGPALYGALMNDSATGPLALTQAQVINNAAADRIQIGSNTTTVAQRVRGLIFIKQSDFTNLQGGNVTFDSASSITIVNPGSSGTYSMRAAVLDNGTWYLSQTAQTAFSGTLSISNAAAANWGAYTPTGAPLAAAPLTFATLGSAFTKIEAVGYWFDASRSSGTNNVSSTTSQITYSAIPEPGTLAFAAIAFGTCVLFLRRKKK